MYIVYAGLAKHLIGLADRYCVTPTQWEAGRYLQLSTSVGNKSHEQNDLGHAHADWVGLLLQLASVVPTSLHPEFTWLTSFSLS